MPTPMELTKALALVKLLPAEEVINSLKFKVSEQKRYGETVFVSEIAEAAREASCLCIHTDDNGREVICRHMANNLAWESRLEKQYEGDQKLIRRQMMQTAEMWLHIMNQGRLLDLKAVQMGPNEICPIALVNFVLCVATNIANAVSWCPHYEQAEEEETLGGDG